MIPVVIEVGIEVVVGVKGNREKNADGYWEGVLIS